MKKVEFQIQSECPILLHNGQTADPLNSYSKEMKRLSGKRGKTDADFEAMMKIEWYASLYVNKDKRIVVPADVLESALTGGAKKHKRGSQAKAGLFVTDHLLLEFDGSDLSIDDLWERDQNRFTKSVRVSTSRVMRTRFIAEEWQGTLKIAYDETLLNEREVEEILVTTGEVVGLCDWRPKYGRFKVA